MFKDQSIFPFIEFIFNRSPKEVMAITSPCSDKAKDKKSAIKFIKKCEKELNAQAID